MERKYIFRKDKYIEICVALGLVAAGYLKVPFDCNWIWLGEGGPDIRVESESIGIEVTKATRNAKNTDTVKTNKKSRDETQIKLNLINKMCGQPMKEKQRLVKIEAEKFYNTCWRNAKVEDKKDIEQNKEQIINNYSKAVLVNDHTFNLDFYDEIEVIKSITNAINLKQEKYDSYKKFKTMDMAIVLNFESCINISIIEEIFKRQKLKYDNVFVMRDEYVYQWDGLKVTERKFDPNLLGEYRELALKIADEIILTRNK